MQAGEATHGGVGVEERVFAREGEAVAPRMQDSIDDIKIEERQTAAEIESVGKYEPKLTENGIPADVLAKLLPGDDALELTEPKVAGGLGYRFVKRVFDVASCFANGLRMRRISEFNCKRFSSTEGQFLAKLVFKAVRA